jgi:hypothetical protein
MNRSADSSSDPAHPSRFEKKTNTLPVAPISLSALHLPLSLGLTVPLQHVARFPAPIALGLKVASTSGAYSSSMK